MALTKSQKEAIKGVIEYCYDDEMNGLCNWMEENGYSDKEIKKFLKMSFGGKVMFLQKAGLTNHIVYHLLVLQTI